MMPSMQVSENEAVQRENDDLCRDITALENVVKLQAETITRQQAALNEIKQVLSGVLDQRPILDEDRSDLEHALDLAKADGGDV